MQKIRPMLPLFPWLLIAALAGCEQGKVDGPSVSAAPPIAAAPSQQPKPETLVRQSWDACYLDGSRIGYVHTAFYRTEVGGRPAVKTVVESKLALVRFGERVEQQSQETTLRSEDGAVIRFEIIAGLGESRQATVGTVEGNHATLIMTAGGKSVTQPIDWPAGTRSSTGLEDELRTAPPKEGESRRFPMFLAMFNSVVDVELKHAGVEPVELDGSRHDLARIDVRATPRGQAGQHLDSTYWIDEQGETLKLAIPALRMTAVRTTAEQARAAPDETLPDIATASFVRPEPSLVGAHQRRFIRYTARLADGAAAEAFPVGSYQTVKVGADGSAEIEVTALRPDVPSPEGAKRIPPVDGDLRPNPFIESDDAQIVAAAREQAGADAEPWTTAVRLESFVHTYLKQVDFSRLFATAAEAYRSKSGDCSEHAMLLCALLRARGIPARTAVGLVYVEGHAAFGYHMWTEAYIGGRWIPLDATVGRGGISAAYLKVSDTNFDGVAPLTSLLPVTKLLGKLKIGIVEAR